MVTLSTKLHLGHCNWLNSHCQAAMQLRGTLLVLALQVSLGRRPRPCFSSFSAFTCVLNCTDFFGIQYKLILEVSFGFSCFFGSNMTISTKMLLSILIQCHQFSGSQPVKLPYGWLSWPIEHVTFCSLLWGGGSWAAGGLEDKLDEKLGLSEDQRMSSIQAIYLQVV